MHPDPAARVDPEALVLSVLSSLEPPVAPAAVTAAAASGGRDVLTQLVDEMVERDRAGAACELEDCLLVSSEGPEREREKERESMCVVLALCINV